MKLILSRKGVDSSAGGFPSPVFADGSLLSIAIPDKRAPLRYADIKADLDVGKLVSQLSAGRLRRRDKVHLDPDIDHRQLDRKPAWRPMFGQCGAAQSHLRSHGVDAGDMFLFFGWFRQAEYVKRRWRYVAGAPDQHVIYGWLQVGGIHEIDVIANQAVAKRLSYHPHFHGKFSGRNTLYEASRNLTVSGLEGFSGGGVFTDYKADRCLTAAGRSRSIWALPMWMHPEGRESVLSYHNDRTRWTMANGNTELRSAARGQEFVLDLDHYPEGVQWLRDILTA